MPPALPARRSAYAAATPIASRYHARQSNTAAQSTAPRFSRFSATPGSIAYATAAAPNPFVASCSMLALTRHAVAATCADVCHRAAFRACHIQHLNLL